MSAEKKLVAVLMSYAVRSPGSHQTRLSRMNVLRDFALVIVLLGGFLIERIEQIGLRHIRFYVSRKLSQGVSVGTLHNAMAHIRVLLRAAGKASLAADPAMSNAALGIGKRGRRGSKALFTDQELNRVLEYVASQRGPGMLAVCLLSMGFGLRLNEVVIVNGSQLRTWRRELAERGQVTVWQGCKGGRARTVIPFNKDVATAVIDYAAGQVGETGYLVRTASGQPTKSLKQSLRVASNFFSRAGIQHHRFRYTYSHYLALLLRGRGYQWTMVWRLVGVYLGHGDSRGRWVKSVYARHLVTVIETEDAKEPMSDGQDIFPPEDEN